MGAIGPAWTRGEIEPPRGEKDMGGWVAAVYTAEQQQRLGVDAEGDPVNRVGPSSTGHREVATIVDIPKRNAARATAKAKARSRWKIAGAVAKAVVAMPMAIGIPVTQVPHDAVWAQATEVPIAQPICPDTGGLQISTTDKMAMVRFLLQRTDCGTHCGLASVPGEAEAW